MKIADDELMEMRGNDLGLDSLISVDIRSWFLKNFSANIPVLKIMALDVQMSSLAATAAQEIPAELIPGVLSRIDSTTPGSDTSGSETNAVGSRLETQNPSSATTPPTPGSPISIDANDKIDWISESSAPQGIHVLQPSAVHRESPRVVLLTGVSGLLGHHLLTSLLQQPSIEEVICVAVRKLSDRISNGEIPPPSSRVTYFEGDLQDPYFGLSEAEFTSIFDRLDAVIHNGSDTSHLKYYSSLRAANVGSTRLILDFAIPRRIPIHYVSSAGVALFAGLDAFPEISATTTGTLPPSDGAHGYMCGKVSLLEIPTISAKLIA